MLGVFWKAPDNLGYVHTDTQNPFICVRRMGELMDSNESLSGYVVFLVGFVPLISDRSLKYSCLISSLDLFVCVCNFFTLLDS